MASTPLRLRQPNPASQSKQCRAVAEELLKKLLRDTFVGFVCASLVMLPVAAREAFAQDKTDTSGSSGGSEGADNGKHNKVDECKFDDINDMVDKVNKESLKHARSVGKNMDKDGNGRNDALEGKYWGTSDALGFYKCSEFSAYLQCMLQELFGCTGDQVQSIADNRHMINKLATSMFKNPPATQTNGFVRIEPQRFFQGPVVTSGLSGGELYKYAKPQPYRAGINTTNYKDLQCVSGPGMKGDGSGASGGLFGGGSAGTSAMLTSMLTSMMGRMGQKNSGGMGNTGGGDSAPAPAPADEGSTVTPVPTATPIATRGANSGSGPAGTPTPRASISATPGTSSAFGGDSADLENKLFPGMGDSDFFRPASQETAEIESSEQSPPPSVDDRDVVAEKAAPVVPTVSAYTF